MTGDLVVGICPDDEHLYWEQGRKLIVQREAQGNVKFTEVGSDGSVPPLEKWKDAPPPSNRSALN